MEQVNGKIRGAAVIALSSILLLGACAETKTNESTGGAYLDDTVITSKVKTAILQDPDLKVMQIQVKTYKGVVQLSGFVGSPQMIGRAGTAARQVPGAALIQNDLTAK